MVLSSLEVDKMLPDLSRLHMVTNVVHGSLKYLLALVLISVIYVVILDGKVDEKLPELNLRSIISESFLKPAKICQKYCKELTYYS